MEQIAEITGILCVSSVVMGILYNTGCFGTTEKVIKFVISIYILVTVIDSFGRNRVDFGFDMKSQAYETYEYTHDYMEYLIAETEKELEKEIESRLSEKNISYNHISVHILEQNNNLTAGKIVADCNADEAAVREILQDIITEDTELVTGE